MTPGDIATRTHDNIEDAVPRTVSDVMNWDQVAWVANKRSADNWLTSGSGWGWFRVGESGRKA
jgi:hypothetical protein